MSRKRGNNINNKNNNKNNNNNNNKMAHSSAPEFPLTSNSYAALDGIYDADVDNDDSFLSLSKQNLTPLPGEKRHPRS